MLANLAQQLLDLEALLAQAVVDKLIASTTTDADWSSSIQAGNATITGTGSRWDTAYFATGQVGSGTTRVSDGGVVASLWAVSDESTAVLMNEFYTRMLGNKDPASEALAAARLELLGHPTYSHPFYWSPFVVIGTGGNDPW